MAIVAAVFVAGFHATAFAQVDKAEKAPAKAAAKSDKDAPKIPEPVDLTLQTGDGLQLALTYYASLKGKQAIPIVMLHGWKQSRSEFKDIAPVLQQLGYAVIVPDLRGHGGSTRRKGASRDDKLDAATMAPSQFSLMVMQDMRAVRDFLWEKNNAGELNIDKLCVVGSEMGASVALDFAWFDAVGYEHGAVNYGPLKLGRFVKALVLISPVWQFPGLPLRRAAGNPAVQSDISMLILVGKQNSKAFSEAKRVYGIFEKWHLEPTGDDKLDRQTLFFGKLPTSSQGTKLLDPSFNLQSIIPDFVDRRLMKSDEAREWTWKERKFPHE